MPSPQDARINEFDPARTGALRGWVARLKGGDPIIFGRGSEEAAICGARIAVDYAPGITAAQGMAASTGVPLTHRGLATGVRYVTGHAARATRGSISTGRSLATEDDQTWSSTWARPTSPRSRCGT